MGRVSTVKMGKNGQIGIEEEMFELMFFSSSVSQIKISSSIHPKILPF